MKRFSMLLVLGVLAAPAWACTAADALKARYGITYAGFEVPIPPASEPAGADKLLTVELEDTTKVFDGFHHTAYVDQSSKKAWILSTGGFAGVRQWFGPVDVQDISFVGCEPVKVAEPSTMRLPEIMSRKL